MDKINKVLSVYIYPIMGLFGVFASTFSSDFTLFGFPAFYFAWLFVIALRIVVGVRFTVLEVVSQFSLLFLLYFSLFPAISDASLYYNAYFFAVLYINVLFFIPFLLKRKVTTYLCFYILTAFSILAMASILSGAVRSYILFGPNVLYRIYAFLFFLMLTTHAFHSKRKIYQSPMMIVAFFSLLIAMVATGSRGAVAVFLLMIVIIVLNFSFFFKKSSLDYLILGTGILFFTVLIILNYDLLSVIFSRLIFFDLTNASELERIGFYQNSRNFIFEEQGVNLLLGVGQENKYFSFYPHNIYIESMVYGGFNMLFISVLTSIVMLWSTTFSNDKYLRSICFIFIGVYFGSLVSGSLLYNFPVFSVGWTALCLSISKLIPQVPELENNLKKVFRH